jgi:hypothetical protein
VANRLIGYKARDSTDYSADYCTLSVTGRRADNCSCSGAPADYRDRPPGMVIAGIVIIMSVAGAVVVPILDVRTLVVRTVIVLVTVPGSLLVLRSARLYRLIPVIWPQLLCCQAAQPYCETQHANYCDLKTSFHNCLRT